MVAVHCCLGGMNTAGLGGVGGPYRLDAGNTVYQVSDFDKAQVPEQVTAVFFANIEIYLRCILCALLIFSLTIYGHCFADILFDNLWTLYLSLKISALSQ